MTSSLAVHYQFDEKNKVWSRNGFDSISYNDGNEIEQRILSIVENARDCSVLSHELRSHCTDWPSLYHLSSSRANILRPFEPKLKGKILEIGAGCGAITRYLGECGADVLALEGTLRRASIARQRTRDLGNVTVLAENFSDFEATEKYDVITLIGVLEYASMFVRGENPQLTMLARARDLLKPDGQLIIAIENQLGLKYFAGAPEDHVGEVSFGLEDRYQPNGVRTYGRRTIEALLKTSGFEDVRIFACFPDYKFPVTIITECGFNSKDFDSTTLATQSVRRDPQLPRTLAFRPERVWPPLVANGLALDLGNSFLISAGTECAENNELNTSLAWHFSTERRANFCKIIEFTRKQNNGIEAVVSRPIKADTDYSSFEDLSNSIAQPNIYFHGPTLSTELADLVTRDGWSDAEIRALLLKYFDVFSNSARLKLPLSSLFEDIIPGKYIDAIPQNFIENGEGNYQLIDTEWQWARSISFAYLLFRALHTLTLSITGIGKHRTRAIQTHAEFLYACFSSIGYPIDINHLADFCQIEQSLQNLVSPREVEDDHILKTLTSSKLNEVNAWQKIEAQDQQIQSQFVTLKAHEATCNALRNIIDEKQTLIEKSEALLHERLLLIHQYEKVVKDRDNLLALTMNSRSWKLTKPLRFIGRHATKANLLRSHELLLTQVLKVARRLRNISNRPTTIFICIHAFYPEVLPFIFEKIKALKIPLRILITTISDHEEAVKRHAENFKLEVDILTVENKGRDILPFLIALGKMRPHDLVLKLHTKKSPHRADGETWRNDMLDKLLNPSLVERILGDFAKQSDLGMVVPEGHALSIEKYMGQNHSWFCSLRGKMPKSRLARDEYLFPGGTMFYARPDALKPLLRLNLKQSDFEAEAKQLDGTLAHAIERLFGASVTTAGFFIATSADPNVAAKENTSEFHPL